VASAVWQARKRLAVFVAMSRPCVNKVFLSCPLCRPLWVVILFFPLWSETERTWVVTFWQSKYNCKRNWSRGFRESVARGNGTRFCYNEYTLKLLTLVCTYGVFMPICPPVM